MENWIDIKVDSPQYYECVFIEMNDGLVNECWRASDGEKNIYTIFGTNNIINENEIKQWKRHKLEEKV